MKIHRTTFAFSEKEKAMLDKMCETMGCNPSELIREWIRTRYLKLFPPYRLLTQTIKEEAEELTPEQLCEKYGGNVVRGDYGSMVCRFTNDLGSFSTEIDLEYPEKFRNAAERMGTVKK